MPEMTHVFSSHVAKRGYDPQTGELHIEWQNGTVTVYGDADHPVPAALGAEVMAAPSIGDALHLAIRGRFPHRTERGDG